MDWQKSAYIGGIIIISLVLLFKWNEFQDKKLEEESLATVVTPGSQIPVTPSGENIPTSQPQGADEIPTAPAVNTLTEDKSSDHNVSNSQLINVVTDTLELMIDPRGDIVKTVLLQHKTKLGGEQGFTILDGTSNTTYVAQSGLVGIDGIDTAAGRPTFNSTQSTYTLEEGEDELTVDLTFTKGGVVYTKRFSFERDSYLVGVHYLINNQSNDPWKGNFYGQIKRDNHKPPAAADLGLGVNPYLGAATTTTQDKYKKLPFEDIADGIQNFTYTGGWVAMVQHYFTSAWIPNKEDQNNFFLKKLNNQEMYLMGFTAPTVTIAAGEQGETGAQFYVGPKDIDRLEAFAENLDLTIDFGFLWWIAKPLFHLLDFFHSYLGNWGWSIIALTLVIKAIFFYPSAMSYKSMARMRKVAPKMQSLKERYGDDRQKMSQEMMKLYKTEKVNPMGGCLPILIQMPVFIALYWVLMESVELRHAPWLGWITDLTVTDPYFVLPLIMGVTMFIQQRLNPTPPDPMQAKVMQWMPVLFTVMFVFFPAGLVLYWVTNNTLSIIQQYIITRKIEREN